MALDCRRLVARARLDTFRRTCRMLAGSRVKSIKLRNCSNRRLTRKFLRNFDKTLLRYRDHPTPTSYIMRHSVKSKRLFLI